MLTLAYFLKSPLLYNELQVLISSAKKVWFQLFVFTYPVTTHYLTMSPKEQVTLFYTARVSNVNPTTQLSTTFKVMDPNYMQMIKKKINCQ